VVSTHGGFFHTGFAARLKQFYFKTVTRLSLSRYAGVAAVGIADAELFKSIRPHGLCLIENGVDVDKYAGASSPSPRKSLIAIGRLSSNKRLDCVIDFLAALRRIDPEWSLYIVGRAWDVSAEHLAQHAEGLGVGGHVRILEGQPDDAVRAVMKNCSAFVSASAYEGFGLVLVEALSAGLWPVVSRIPTFSDVVARTGIGTVADFQNSDAAARKFLTDWAAVSRDYSGHRERARASADGFKWSSVNARYAAFYESARGEGIRTILNTAIQVKTSREAIDLLDRKFMSGTPEVVVFANAHTLNSTTIDDRVRSVLDRSIVFNDGIGVDIASRLLFGKAFPENLNGTDFIPHYLQQSRHRYRIFLLGGQRGVASEAAGWLAKIAPRHEFVGSHHGYFSKHEQSHVIDQIRRSRADILLVAMGNPHQETWLDDHLKETGCALGFGVGGLFDFTAGVVPRAPKWVQSARMEWSYRLLQQPGRLWRRYLVQMPVFLMRVFHQWLAGARVPDGLSR
jgi:alpha-1,3-mannosyltransferase